MQDFCVTLETTPMTDAEIDRVHQVMADWGPAVSETPDQTCTVLVTVPAAWMTAALAGAIEMLGREVLSAHVIPAEMRDAREGWDPGSAEWMTTTEAAEALGITQQSVNLACREGRLASRKIGRDRFVARAAVEARCGHKDE